MNEKSFYNHLLSETKRAFDSSPIKTYQRLNSYNWNYAICETPIRKERGVILGLNWGGTDHDAQIEYPTLKKERNWNFLANSRRYFEKHLNVNKIDNINYTNLCFFRSPNLSYLNWADWELAIPLFRKYVEFIQPSWTVLLGVKGVEILNYFSYLTNLDYVEVKGRKTSYGYKGTLFNKYSFFCVPHPQAKIETDVRDEVWEKVFNSFNDDNHRLSSCAK